MSQSLLGLLAHYGFLHTCLQSFCLVAIAELFDKTWFVALLMAMNHPRSTVFWGCYSALALHTVIAAGFGYAVSRLMPIAYLHFMAAGLYALFAMLYAKDFYNADPAGDMIEAGKEEAGEALPIQGAKQRTDQISIFGQCFMAMFVAEWGDRTQIAMIGQHASQPLTPVCIGSLIAFFILTSSAVLAGSLLSDHRVSERFVFLSSSLCFAIFSLLALRDGFASIDESLNG
eukprot:TRINITY_DN5710_c1_g2_i1.p1 TRINITY_DN5710_c1_g2~~TRINITY_DN5710_c1_g2_i1.p1  ORF type:complete len:249 (+),score=36.78 TRINITY_DN5710_c1_g2_i1:58-747(+)